MGTAHSVELFADQDSPSEPGKQSIISGAFDELTPPVDSSQVFAGLLDHFKRPIDETTEAVLKSCEVTENAGPDDFTVKVIVDGAKLDRYGYGRGDGMDRVRSWRHIVVDRAAKRVTLEDYVSEIALGEWADKATNEEVLATVVIQLLEAPPRLELWIVGKDGTRHASQGLADGSYPTTDKVIRQIQDSINHKVQARQAKSLTNSGEDSILTDPMDAHIDFDAFFDKMITVVKEKFEKIPESQVEVGAGEVIARVTRAGRDGQDEVHIHQMKHCVESGEVTIAHFDHEGKPINTSFRIVHKSPLVVEAWNVTLTGERSAGEAFCKLVQREVNEVIDRANSWFG